MTYEETLHYLYTSVPVFQHSGASAYKPGLATSIALDDHLNNPHRSYRTIHVAGTNGKGSVSHLLAAILQESGYKVGLYTSPHLVDFRERIRVNGKKISQEYVIGFVEKYRSFFETLSPSFFELTSTMAFDYFRSEKVDVAIIETGLGGRLDSTNIITPILSVITNISADHQQFLGDTSVQIASEKAGIIKETIPVVIGEVYELEVKDVFEKKAQEMHAPIYFAQWMDLLEGLSQTDTGHWQFDSTDYGVLDGELSGSVQSKNAQTVLAALRILNKADMKVSRIGVRHGFAKVTELTGLMGRWQTLQDTPKVICDTGHNEGGWNYLSAHLEKEMETCNRLHMVIGMVNDKDVKKVLSLMPKHATYYFTRASIDRAMPAEELAKQGELLGLKGNIYPTVQDAVKEVLTNATENDLVFIGGSTFIVADALPLFPLAMK